jgi:hypothetical protein
MKKIQEIKFSFYAFTFSTAEFRPGRGAVHRAGTMHGGPGRSAGCHSNQACILGRLFASLFPVHTEDSNPEYGTAWGFYTNGTLRFLDRWNGTFTLPF